MQAKLRDVAAWSGGFAGDAAGDTLLTGVSTDTRTIKPGQLFVPLVGERFDGHDYLNAAIAAGAAAALWQRSRPVPADPGVPLILVNDTLDALQTLASSYLETLGARVVSVTGSNGKTTTKDLVSSVLAVRYNVHKTEGNFNNHIGLPLTILRASPDTEVLVLEKGMSGFGEIAKLCSIAQPDVAIVTNIGESHLLQLGTRNGIARAKLEIAAGLKSGGVLVMNGDEPLLAEELAGISMPEGASVLTFGAGEGNDWRATDIEVTTEGAAFNAVKDGVAAEYRIPVPGRHNAVNALAAVAAGRLFGLSAADIREGLASAKLTGMRIERSTAKNGAVILNDAYNASPTSVRAAIDLVAGLDGYSRKWIVLGDMLELGGDEAAYHAEIGRYVTAGKAYALWAYGPLSAHTIEHAGLPSQGEEATARHYTDKERLASELLSAVGPHDLVLVKASRGMKLEQIVTALQKGAEG
ncbi:UDP-N-acetylmuramoyl-tripeptide--D-alanyl-D-alanine ligase [Cohnella faecalis]|nr:UDP-N-acetylmuramoyl-tripeptide--D-alanyl-D-alanine ligase [Cohnella faecalis]